MCSPWSTPSRNSPPRPPDHETPDGARERARRADAREEVRDAAPGLPPDFRRRALVVRAPVGGVVVLVGPVGAGQFGVVAAPALEFSRHVLIVASTALEALICSLVTTTALKCKGFCHSRVVLLIAIVASAALEGSWKSGVVTTTTLETIRAR